MVRLDEFDLEPGESVERSYDLTDHVPARVEVHLLTSREEHERCRAWLVRHGERGPVGWREPSDAKNGVFTFEALPAGSWSAFLVRPHEWTRVVAAELEVAPGSEHRLETCVDLHRGEVRLHGPDGEPLEDESFWICEAAPRSLSFLPCGSRQSVLGSGRAELELPAGSYRIHTASHDRVEKGLVGELVWPTLGTAFVHLREPE